MKSMLSATKHLQRVRTMGLALPGSEERVSHGEPTFFVGGKVFVMFANNHHRDGRVAIWVPAPPGYQAAKTAERPKVFFVPPYVGHRGWVGIVLSQINDKDLRFHIQVAWELIAPKKVRAAAQAATAAEDWPQGIGAPARRALAQAGYTRLDQLNGAPHATLSQLHGMGPKALAVLDAALKAHGMALR
jgi:hypothetical protein